MRFPNVTITEPGPSGANVYRFTNLRASIPTSSLSQVPVNVTVTLSNPSLPPNPNPTFTVAVATRGITDPQLRTPDSLSPLAQPVTLSRCLTNNLSLANAPATATYTEGRTLTLRLGEWTPTSLMKRGSSSYVDANTFPAIAPPTSVGLPYSTESMLWSTDAAWPKSPAGVPAGQADAGTRVFVKFTSIPAGVRIFGAANDQGAPADASIKRVRAVNMHASLGTAGPTAVAPLANSTIEGGLIESQAFGGARWLLYEVLPSIDTLSVETLDLPIAIAHKGGRAVGTGTMKIQAGLGPISSLATPDATTIIPRFQDLSVAQNAVTITPCICTFPRAVLNSVNWLSATLVEFNLSFTNTSASPMFNVGLSNIRGFPSTLGITTVTSSSLVLGTLAPAQTANATIQLNVPAASRLLSKSLIYTLSMNSGACSTITQWMF